MRHGVIEAKVEPGILIVGRGVMEDPLAPDGPGDAEVVTTRRGLVRLALVAAETGARFNRDGIDQDAVAWMVAPCRLFGGNAAVTACLAREDCVRAVLLHALALGLDADPGEVDALRCAMDPGDPDDGYDDGNGDHDIDDVVELVGMPPRLWTSLLVEQAGSGLVHAFDAFVARTRMEAEARLRARHGARTAGVAEVVEGFDPTRPLVEALVSPAIADMLRQVASDPASPLAQGLSVSIEQRFSA